MTGPAMRGTRFAALVLVASDHPLPVREVLEAGGGQTVGSRDDGAVLCLFRDATEAGAAVLVVQRRFPAAACVLANALGDPGDAHAVTRSCDALLAVSGPGRTMLSVAAAAAMSDALPAGAWLRDLGSRALPGRTGSERVFELLHEDVAGPRPAGPPSHNLPAQLTTFVGRAAELATLRELLDDHRLVTVTGAGGSGKTRLAWQLAAGSVDSRPDGVCWVDLGAITDPDRVPRVVAAAVGAFVGPSGDVVSVLAAQLHGRRILMCLDTCEHLLDACAHLALTVLRTCPEVAVLATSREMLGVPGELVWRAPPLDPDDAARLFADRAALVRPDPPDPDEEAVVRAICRRLDDMPLAIELAAAWTRVLPPSAIDARLDDRFRLLVGGPRGVADRHRTLAASIGWSQPARGVRPGAAARAVGVLRRVHRRGRRRGLR